MTVSPVFFLKKTRLIPPISLRLIRLLGRDPGIRLARRLLESGSPDPILLVLGEIVLTLTGLDLGLEPKMEARRLFGVEEIVVVVVVVVVGPFVMV